MLSGMRILWFLLLVPVIIVTAAWALLPVYLPPIARQAAATHDIELTQLDVSRPHFSGWVIRDAALRLPDGTRASVADLRVHWHPHGLRLGRLTRVDIARLRVQPATSAGTPQEQAVVPTVIPAYMLEQLPVDAWSIAGLQVELPALASGKVPVIHTVANGNKSRISLFSRVAPGQGVYLSRLEAVPGIHHEWQLETYPSRQPVLQLTERRPRANGTETQGQAQVEAGRLATLLHALGFATGVDPEGVNGLLRLHWQGVLPATFNAAQPLRGLTLTGQAQAELDVSDGSDASARVDAALSFTIADERVEWELAPETRLRVRHPALAQMAAENLGVKSGQVWAEVTSALPLNGQWAPPEPASTLNGTLHLEIHGGDRLLGHQRVTIRESLVGPDRFEGALHSAGSLQPQDADLSPLREFGWDLQAQVVATPDRIQMLPGLAGNVRVQPFDTQGGKIPRKSNLRLRSDAALEMLVADGSLHWKHLQVTVPETLAGLLRPVLADTGVQLEGDAPRLVLRNLQYDGQEGFRTAAELRIRNLLTRTECCQLGRIDARLDARVDASGARGTFRLDDAAARPVLHSDWTFGFASARLEGSLEVLPGLTFPDGQERLAALLSPWPEQVRLLKGTHGLAGSYWFERAEGLNADLHWYGRDWLVQREEMQVKGVTFDARPEIRATGIGLGQYAHFQVRELDAGFPIRNIRGDLWVRIPLREKDAPVLVRHFSAELLGGRVSAAEVPLPVGRDEVRFTLDVEGIELAALLQLEQRDDLSGSGRLDGSIPFRWSEAGLAVDRGRLAARAPGGVLQYRPDAGTRALARSQPGLGVAIRALENFRYDLLEAGLDYREDGRLLIRLKIQGENPELHGGHPVHLNISVEENVLTLLKSLQYSDELTGRIGEKFEKGN